MNTKTRRPKINIPSYVKVSAMLSPSRKGIINRSYIKMMTTALDSFYKHKNSSLKKYNKELSDES